MFQLSFSSPRGESLTKAGASMFHATLPSPALRQFQSRVHGRLICKGDEDYDQARRVWNGRIDKYPLALVYCSDVADVVTAVAFAREHHLANRSAQQKQMARLALDNTHVPY